MWIFEGSHYLYPERAYLMLGVPCIIVLFWWLSYQRSRYLQEFFKGDLTAELSEMRSPLLMGLKTALLCLSWMMATLALMYPYTAIRTASSPPALPKEARSHDVHDVILLVDASASMAIADGRSGESRLTSAKQIADELLTQLHGESIALYAFTSQLIPEVPLTLDYLFLRLMLRQIVINVDETAGTDFLQVLNDLRIKYWKSGSLANKSFTLVIFSDGGDTEWESLKGDAKSARLQQIADTVKDVDGLRVIAVGIGSEAGGEVPDLPATISPVQSRLEIQILNSLTKSDGHLMLGNVTSAFETSRKIAALLARHDRAHATLGAATRHPGAAEQLPDSLYHIPLALAILSLIAALLLPEREPTRVAT